MSRAKLRALRVVFAALSAVAALATEDHGPAAPSDRELEQVEALLAVPPERWSLADAKLTVDRLIDPAVDATATARQLDRWAARIQARVPADAPNRARLELLLESLYRPGRWNDYRPFRYDLDDPYGRDARHKLLSRYLETRQGNCVTMPVLLAILAERLGLPVALAAAPGHLLVKFRTDDGHWTNVEATSGGFKHDASYVRELEISPRALANGLYLRALGPREATGALLGPLMEFHDANDRQARRMAIADLALAANPDDVVALLHKASAAYALLQARYERRFASPAAIPAEQKADYLQLSRDNLALFARAEALGWTPSTAAGEAAYRESVARERAARRGER